MCAMFSRLSRDEKRIILASPTVQALLMLIPIIIVHVHHLERISELRSNDVFGYGLIGSDFFKVLFRVGSRWIASDTNIVLMFGDRAAGIAARVVMNTAV
jgi:hypothetical protein